MMLFINPTSKLLLCGIDRLHDVAFFFADKFIIDRYRCIKIHRKFSRNRDEICLTGLLDKFFFVRCQLHVLVSFYMEACLLQKIIILDGETQYVFSHLFFRRSFVHCVFLDMQSLHPQHVLHLLQPALRSMDQERHHRQRIHLHALSYRFHRL